MFELYPGQVGPFVNTVSMLLLDLKYQFETSEIALHAAAK